MNALLFVHRFTTRNLRLLHATLYYDIPTSLSFFAFPVQLQSRNLEKAKPFFFSRISTFLQPGNRELTACMKMEVGVSLFFFFFF